MNNPENCTFTDSLKIKFGGDNAISIQQLFGYITGIESAYKGYVDAKFQETDVELNVLAVKQGSFEIELQSVVALAPTLFTYVPQFITTFKDLLEIIKIKRELKGKQPKEILTEGNQAKIVTHDGDIHYHNCDVVNLYVNVPAIDQGLTNAFAAAIQGRDRRQSISLSSKQETVEIDKKSFNELAIPIVEEKNQEEELSIQKCISSAQLKIRKCDFVGDTMWGFIDEKGKFLSAVIEDEDFLARVRSGKIKFSVNDVLSVRLRAEAEFDKYFHLQRTKYFIEQVEEIYTQEKTIQESLPIDKFL